MKIISIKNFKKEINNGKLTSKAMVSYLLSLKGITCPTESDINKISLNMLVIDGYKVVSAMLDQLTYELNIELGEKVEIKDNREETTEITSACMISNEYIKFNGFDAVYTVNDEYLIVKQSQYNRDYTKKKCRAWITGKGIKINRDIFNLITGTLEDDTIKEYNLLPNYTLEEIHNIYKWINELNFDKEILESNKSIKIA